VAGIFHLLTSEQWRAAQAAGSYAPESLRTEGFVHFSLIDQVAGTANTRFRDSVDLIVIEVLPQELSQPVVLEDLYGMGQEFPHVYGPIPVSAVVAVHALGRDEEGNFTFAPGG